MANQEVNRLDLQKCFTRLKQLPIIFECDQPFGQLNRNITAMSILKITNLQKNYGSLKALDGLDLTIEKGQAFGILGPNGSGKTTTLGIVLGTLFANGGDYSWFESGKSNDLLKRVGSLLETPNFFPYLNAYDNLKIIAHIREVENPGYDAILKLVNLAERGHSNFSTYSFGMKQRLAIGAALIGDPEVLILDEPTNGLDPQGIIEVREIIQKIAKSGKTIIMASHILDEVEKICSHVAILNKGRLIATGPVGAIIHNKPMYIVGGSDIELINNTLGRCAWVQDKIILDNNLIEITTDEHVSGEFINKFFYDNDIILSHIQLRRKRLEEEFIEIVKKVNG